MNYEEEYNKLFEYFLGILRDDYPHNRRLVKIKTSDDLIEEFGNYDVDLMNKGDRTDLYDCQQTENEREIKVLEDLTSIIETLKTQLKELRKSVSKKSRQKIDDLIELAYTRKNIYCSENDKPTKQHVKEFYKSFPLIEEVEEETTIDNEIPDW